MGFWRRFIGIYKIPPGPPLKKGGMGFPPDFPLKTAYYRPLWHVWININAGAGAI